MLRSDARENCFSTVTSGSLFRSLVLVTLEGANNMLIYLTGPDVQFNFGVLSLCVIR